MYMPLGSRIGRLAIIEHLLAMALVAPKGLSLRLFASLGREIGDLRVEMETELQLDALVIARLTATAGQRPLDEPASVDRNSCIDEQSPFDDGEHLVEDQIAPAVYERPT